MIRNRFIAFGLALLSLPFLFLVWVFIGFVMIIIPILAFLNPEMVFDFNKYGVFIKSKYTKNKF